MPLNDALRRYKIEREEIQTRALAGCRVQARRKAGRRIEEEVREDLA